MASASWAWPPVRLRVIVSVAESQRSCSLRRPWQLLQRALRLQSKAVVVPLVPIAFGGPISSTFSEKKSLVSPRPLFAVPPCFLLGLVPAGKELLRRLLVAPLQVAHVRNVVVVLFPVSK
jgi:hypothetical protein